MTKKNKNRFFGIISTIVFHAIALVLLMTLCFRTPLPLPGEAGVEVNLGMYAQGSGHNSSPKPAPAPQPVPQPAPKVEEKVEETIEEEILNSEEDVPSIEEKKEENVEEVPEKKEEVVEEIVEEKPEEVVEEKPVVNQRAMFQGRKNEQAQSSEGNTKGDGIQGSEHGLKDIERYDGNGGSGGGPAFDLGGRGAKSIPSPSRDFSEEGKVVVDIWVDKDGIVRRAEIGRGTTVLNESMRSSALEAAKKSVFNQDDKAADLQKGTITYTFIIRQ